MTQNARYSGHNIDPSIDELLVRPVPISLTAEEIDAEHHPITETDQPIPVTAWVRFHEATIRPKAEAIAWNDRAVQVRWTMKNGATRTVWVWASAVERRPGR